MNLYDQLLKLKAKVIAHKAQFYYRNVSTYQINTCKLSVVLSFRELLTSVNPFVTVLFLLFRNSVFKRWEKKGSDEQMQFRKLKERLKSHSTVNNSLNGSMAHTEKEDPGNGISHTSRIFLPFPCSGLPTISS